MTRSDEVWPFRFGAMPPGDPLTFSGGAIRPVSSAMEAWRLEAARTNARTRKIYPPIVHTERGTGPFHAPHSCDLGSRRTATIYPLPITHELTLDDPAHAAEPEEYPGRQFPGFLVYVLGFTAGLRLQLSPWRVTGDRPGKSVRSFEASPREVERILEAAASRWWKTGQADREALFNVLFQAGRLGAIEHPWEDFALACSLMDACFRLEGGPQGLGHGRRMVWLSERFEMPLPKGALDAVAMLNKRRNVLVHELSWGGAPLGFGHPPSEEFTLLTIHSLLDRIILAMLGIDCPYIATPWWSGSARQLHHLDLRR